MLRARGARGRRDSLLQYLDAPHQRSDPRSDSKKRAEDRMTERSAREKRTNDRERERGGPQTELRRAPTRRHQKEKLKPGQNTR